MKKIRNSVTLALLCVAGSTLTACGPKESEGVKFWSSFGGSYTNVLNEIVPKISSDTGVSIEHTSQNSYPNIRREMNSAIAVGDYPNIAMGYPDHFAQYLGANILTSMDSYVSSTELSDYYEDYMTENYFYDGQGQKHLYALPFNKSTEVLGYNGVFVDYCASLSEYSSFELDKIPTTWQEWAVKGPQYMSIFTNLMDSKQALCGKQTVEGSASDFKLANKSNLTTDPTTGNLVDSDGRIMLLDFTNSDKNTSRLLSWDATDNAFITLLKQWGAKYTELPSSQYSVNPKRRAGNVLFNSAENKPKVVSMLKFFKQLNSTGIFGVPSELGGSFSSDAFELNKVMFMICSSGGLSYNTKNKNYRFRIAPIPYYNEGGTARKLVISQGANICLTNKGSEEDSMKVVKALTSGKYQTEWCLSTGYYPSSKSAANSAEYQAFLNEAQTLSPEEAYANPTRVAYREGSKVNSEEYMNLSKGWTKFVDDAFIGSSEIREAVANVFKQVFLISNEDINDDTKYEKVLNDILSDENIKDSATINIVK